MKSVYVALLVSVVINVYAAQLSSQLPKNAPCPAGYATSGNYCKPGHSARFAIEKHGVCPATYTTSGGFCLSGHSSRLAIHKIGVCSSGWSLSGDYCLKNR